MRWSYSKLGMYKECPAKVKYRYIDKLPSTPGPAAARGVAIHAKIESYLKGESTIGEMEEVNFYGDWLARLRVLGAQPELKIAVKKDWSPCGWEDPDVWGVGVIDAWLPSAPIAWDWKTGKVYEEDHFAQRELYTAMLFGHVPDAYEVKFSHVYVDIHKERTTTFHRNTIPDLRKRWSDKISIMEADTIMAPNPSFKCRWCPYSKQSGGPCDF